MSIKGAENNPSLNLFRVPPVDLSTVKSRFMKVSPQTSSITPIEMYVPRQTEFIDLGRRFVELDLTFKTTASGNLTTRATNAANLTCSVNNVAHSLFKQINVKLNGTLMTEQVDMYHLKAYIHSWIMTMQTRKRSYKQQGGETKSIRPGLIREWGGG